MFKWVQLVALVLRALGLADVVRVYLARRAAASEQKLKDQLADSQEVIKTVEVQHEVQAGVMATDDELAWLLKLHNPTGK